MNFGLNSETARQLQHIVDAIGVEDTKAFLADGATVTGLYRALDNSDRLPAWVTNALSMQCSIQAAKKRGSWSDEDQESAALIASWLAEQ